MNTVLQFVYCGALCSLFAWTITSQAADASDGKQGVQLISHGEQVHLPEAEREYLIRALARINRECMLTARSIPSRKAKNSEARLSLFEGGDQILVVDIFPRGVSPQPELEISGKRNGQNIYLNECDGRLTLPVASIMSVYATELPTQVTRHNERRVSSYERNSLGWTHDDNSVDIGYLDANLSFKYRAAAWGSQEQYAAYATFSTRFSQYIGSIDSNPVVGKSYNPSIFGRRYFIRWPGFIDIGYAHESNGQGITSREAFISERIKYEDSDNEPDFARNFLSRGWDYILVDWNHCWVNCPGARFYNGEGALVTNFSFDYFLDDGLAQGDTEEINEWESEFYDVEGNEKRKEYDGLGLRTNYTMEKNCLTFNSLKCILSWEYTTGYDNIFHKSTNRFELIMQRWNYASVSLWYRTGYNSSLVDYFENVDSYGFTFVFDRTF